MSNETPAAASPSAAPPAVPSADCSGSGPAVRSFCRRPTGLRSRPACRQWSDGLSDNEKRLYGALMGDVTFLRRRGFGVHCEGTLFRVGNRLVDADELVAIAAREPRLTAK